MFGLFQICNIYTRNSVSDNYGGTKSIDTILHSNVPCRFTKSYSSDKEEFVGVGGKNYWFISVGLQAPLPRKKEDNLALYSIEFENIMYDVIQWEERNDEFGYLNHIEFSIELRE